MIANALTYEIMTPESVGRNRGELVLGKHSGKHGLANRAEELGYALSDEELKLLYEKFIDLADKKKEVFEDDLRMLIVSLHNQTFEIYHLKQIRTSGHDPAMALVELSQGNETMMDTSVGDGPVHAAFMAVDRIAGISGMLEHFEVRATTPGKDALGEAYVTVKFDGKSFKGNGASTDIIEAAVQAYVNAVNKFIALKNEPNNGTDILPDGLVP